VDHFIVTDNGSTDETVDILARYAKAGLMTVIERPTPTTASRARSG
jgi:glycosyltransferase involved in cell wall biosynthesis